MTEPHESKTSDVAPPGNYVDGESRLDLTHFWPSLLKSVGVEPKEEIESLKGASGLDHKVIAAGVDSDEKRLVIVSGEADASGAAMAQADIQASIDEVKVIVARPAIFDVGALGRAAVTKSGRPELTSGDLSRLSETGTKPTPESMEAFNEMFGPIMQQIETARSVPSIGFMQAAAQLLGQAAQADWSPDGGDDPLVDFSKLLSSPPSLEDSKLGVCAIPLYKLGADELELINSGANLDGIVQLLRDHGVYQYFFPPADQTALALIDRGQASSEEVATSLETSSSLGHPFGDLELVPANTPFSELIDEMKERKYIVEGESELELTEEGQKVRQVVRVKPREGFVSKLLNRVYLKVNLKSLFKLG